MRLAVAPTAALLALACTPAYVDTVAPEDAAMSVGCGDAPCGEQGEASVTIDVSFARQHRRRITVCCSQLDELRSRIATARDYWCDGLDMPDQFVGGVTISTTISEISDKRAVTLDQGEGYISFQCDGWLPELEARLGAVACCAPPGPAPVATDPADG